MKLIAAAVLALAATPAAATCLRMEGPPPGTTAGVGPLLSVADGDVFLRPFRNGGGWTAAGSGTIVVSNNAAGSPVQEMNLNNINLQVIPDPPVTEATFLYADFGGNVNLRVNGAFVWPADLSGAPAVMGGVNVAVTRINFPFYHLGVVTLTAGSSDIASFAVGGQEFFVDDVCW